MPPKKKQKTATTPKTTPRSKAPSSSSSNNRDPTTLATSPPPKSSKTSRGRGGRKSKTSTSTGLTAAQEEEVKEVWALFARNDVEGFEDEDGGVSGVLRREDVGRCLSALSLSPSSPAQLQEFLEILDPDDSGFVTYAHFREICALQVQTLAENKEGNGEIEVRREEEVTAAMKLFTQGVEREITIEDLRRVRGVLGEEGLGEEVLRAMVGEANRVGENGGGDGVGGRGMRMSVGREAFRSVMVRTGVLR